GVVAVICVPLTTTTLVAAAAPNVTVAPAAKFDPVIVTAVPPAVDPLFGATLLTVGATTSAPLTGTITPNHGVLPPVHVVVAVWIRDERTMRTGDKARFRRIDVVTNRCRYAVD